MDVMIEQVLGRFGFLVWMLAWFDIVVVGGTLLFALGWHIYYVLADKRKSVMEGLKYSGTTYNGNLLFHGMFTCLVLILLSGLSLSAGQNITARLGSAKVEMRYERSFGTGVFVKMDDEQLPNKSWLVSPSEPLFVQVAPDKHGRRVVVSARSNVRELKRIFAHDSTIEIVEVRWRYRYPARPFRWMGPITDRSDVIKMSDGKERVVTGLTWWTSIKS